MLSSVPSENAKNQAVGLGMVASILKASSFSGTYSMCYFRDIIEPASKQQLFKMYFDNKGRPIGFVVWAFIAQDVEDRFADTGTWNLHESEWREGATLWIIDFVCPFGHLRHVLDALRDDLFVAQTTVRYARRKRDRLIIKEVSRNSISSFFKKSNAKIPLKLFLPDSPAST